MRKALTNAWQTLTATVGVVMRNRTYRYYPLYSYALLLLFTFAVVLPLLAAMVGPAQQGWAGWSLLVLTIYLAYGALYFVMAFGNTMLVMGLASQLDGAAPVSTGTLFTHALQRLGLIAVYTLVSATLGVISFVVRSLLNPLLGRVILPQVKNRLWLRWHQLSYKLSLQLTIPVIALDQPPPTNPFQRSERLIKETWGEGVKPVHGIGLLALLVLLPILILSVAPALQQGFSAHNPDLIRQGLTVLLVTLGTYMQISGLVDAILALAAYRYATVQKSDLFPGDPSYAEHAFVKAQKTTDRDDALTTALADAPPLTVEDLSG